MAQREPNKSARVEQVLKLVGELLPEEREAVLFQLKAEELRREIQKGIDSSESGDVFSEEDVWKRLSEHRRQFLDK